MTNIFISSKMPELEPEREIAKETLLSLGFKETEVIMWEDFPARPNPPEDVFLRKVESSQMFILILWKEYSKQVVEEFRKAKKCGIPILVFIKKLRSDWKERQEPQVQELIDSEIRPYLSWKDFRTLSELRSLLREAIITELCQHLEKPFLSHSSQDLYELGEHIAASSKSRVYLLARSLILITGPRPYLSNSPIEYEKSHFDCLMNIVEESKKGRIRFFCGYTIQLTLKELTDYPLIRELSRERLTRLFNDSSANDRQSKFTLATPPVIWEPSFTFIVGDDRFAIWFKDPKNPEIYPCISAEESKIATALIHIFEDVCQQKPLQVLLEELQLT